VTLAIEGAAPAWLEPAPLAAHPQGAPVPAPTSAVPPPPVGNEEGARSSQPSEIPTQEGPRGLRYDFNDGCRVALPDTGHPWRVRISDIDTGNILFETEIKAGRINSTKRYFVNFRLEAWQQGERVLLHDYCAAGREVLIRLPVDTLGDVLGWFPYAVKFKERHGCKLTCAISRKLHPLFANAYPDISFLTEQEIQPERYYAAYTIAVYFKEGAVYDYKDRVPCDFRRVGLHRAAGYILGVDPTEVPPRIAIPDPSRPIAERYVCIAVQSTCRRDCASPARGGRWRRGGSPRPGRESCSRSR
jgi:autotransporter strand-loop-strand O-heptosyltransferase